MVLLRKSATTDEDLWLGEIVTVSAANIKFNWLAKDEKNCWKTGEYSAERLPRGAVGLLAKLRTWKGGIMPVPLKQTLMGLYN